MTLTVLAYAHLSTPFDYNKIPLAPIKYGAQVHEKTDKRGTSAYHSVDRWYMSRSPEYYRMHVCHMKTTKSKQLTDTLQLSHGNITNPTITHVDKRMNAISVCAVTLKGVAGGKTPKRLQDRCKKFWRFMEGVC